VETVETLVSSSSFNN